MWDERGADRWPVAVAAFTRAVSRRARVGLAVLAADEPVATAVGDVGELGDVDVDQRAGVVVLVAAQGFAGDAVEVAEPVDPAPHQHRVDGRGGQAEPAGDLDRAESLAPPQPHDPPHHLRAGPGWARVGSRAAVLHAGDTLGPVAVGPILRCARGDQEHLGRSGVGPAAVDDELGQPQTGAWGQDGVSVGHEGLRSVKAVN